MAGAILNPILPGFHPDPSFIRVGADYYIAASTFEWFPGVALFHSRDLQNWRPLGQALTRRSQMDLTAVPDSGGIWAPSLSHHDGRFWLVYTVMRTRTGPYKDMVNRLVTADAIEGPWSDPIELNSRGFDPSLFHDDDGRKWLVQILWDHRKDQPSFGGITVQEFDPATQILRGPTVKIFAKKDVLIEGPNLYKRNGWYYLLLAEGGTSWNHAVSLVRSRTLTGPYEEDPLGVVLTSGGRPELPLQKAGHGELVETPAGEWVLAHLASRPLATPLGPRCPLGRETCLQNVVWSEDGWLRLAGGGTAPAITIAVPREHPAPAGPPPSKFSDFTGPEWCSLRGPNGTWADFRSRPGWLRLRGQESPASLHAQSLLARRVTTTEFFAEVRVDFQPAGFLQMAGLICYYDTKTHHYFRITRNDAGRILGVVSMEDGRYSEQGDVPIPEDGEIRLGVEWSQTRLQFYFANADAGWQPVGPTLDASVLSDDFGTGLHFTGAFLGVCAQDFDTHSTTADFTAFRYSPRTGHHPYPSSKPCN